MEIDIESLGIVIQEKDCTMLGDLLEPTMCFRLYLASLTRDILLRGDGFR